MRRKLRAARRLSPAERVLLGRAWLRLLWVGVALRVFPLPQVQSALRARSSRRQPVPAHRLAYLVDAAARHHVLPLHCLQRALVLQSLLAESGERADLRIGVRRIEDGMEAHAWVEHDGRILGDFLGLAGHYLPLERT